MVPAADDAALFYAELASVRHRIASCLVRRPSIREHCKARQRGDVNGRRTNRSHTKHGVEEVWWRGGCERRDRLADADGAGCLAVLGGFGFGAPPQVHWTYVWRGTPTVTAVMERNGF